MPPLFNGTYKILSGASWLSSVTALHAHIRHSLPDHKKHGFLPRDEMFFAALLAGRGGTLWGVFNEEGALVGLGAVQIHASWLAAKLAGHVSVPDETGPFMELCGEESVAVIQSLGVLPAANGKRLAQGLIQNACLWAYSQKASHMFAQVAQDNMCSWLQFLKQGFGIAAAWNKGHGRYLLYRHLKPQDLITSEASFLAANTPFFAKPLH